MPSVSEMKAHGSHKFKKRDYRSWNMDGKTELSEPDFAQSFSSDQIVSIPPSKIRNWAFHDRPENELGDIEALAKEFTEIGQQQPCIVRLIENDEPYLYELIVGERRWRASLKAGVDLKVIVNPLSDGEAAIIQSSENSNRKDLSDYAKGMSYFRLIQEGILTQADLVRKLNLNRQTISRFLCFAKIPEIVSSAINDFSKISSGTAEKIKQLCEKGQKYEEAVVFYAPLLQEGKCGHKKLSLLVENYVLGDTKTKNLSKKIYSRNGRLLFSVRKDKSKYLSLSFPKDISNLFFSKKLDALVIEEDLKKVIEEHLMKI